jgi:tungstate transport system substrate-binding protein
VLTLLALAGCGGGGGGASQAGSAAAKPHGPTILATTTSTQDSGLLDALLPAFARTCACTIKTVAVGSGQALALGRRADADVLLVHSPTQEQAFMREGHGASRAAVMHNDFVVVGPPADPAKVKGARGGPAAFRRIAAARALFAARGDGSGTDVREQAIWKAAGIVPRAPWRFVTGQGMGQTLQIASQRQAYTLSDRGTFLATKNLDLRLLAQGGSDLRNPYHVIVVRGPEVNAGCARAFASWITSPPTQRRIARFGVKRYGQPLFFPDADAAR